MDKVLELQVGVMNIMDESGHQQVNWNVSNSKEVEAAQKTFDRLVRQGYVAFGSTPGTDTKRPVTAFDPTTEELVMVPRIVGG